MWGVKYYVKRERTMEEEIQRQEKQSTNASVSLQGNLNRTE